MTQKMTNKGETDVFKDSYENLRLVRGAITNHNFGHDLPGRPDVLAPEGVDLRLGCCTERTEFARSSCSDSCSLQAHPELQKGAPAELPLSWFCS